MCGNTTLENEKTLLRNTNDYAIHAFLMWIESLKLGKYLCLHVVAHIGHDNKGKTNQEK
jgi:hypothetical protein